MLRYEPLHIIKALNLRRERHGRGAWTNVNQGNMLSVYITTVLEQAQEGVRYVMELRGRGHVWTGEQEWTESGGMS